MRNPDRETVFRFKRFKVINRLAAMKVGTDGVLLGAWASVEGVRRVLDVGTGCGLIALMIAQRAPEAVIKAVEIDDDAASEATLNVASSPWGDRIEVVKADFLSLSPGEGEHYDLIVSNPPFFTETLRSADVARAMARHGDTLSIESLVDRASRWLAPGGRLAVVAPVSRDADLLFAAALAGLHPVRLTKVFTKARAQEPARVLREFSFVSGPLSSGVLRSGTDEWSALTKDFYLDKDVL